LVGCSQRAKVDTQSSLPPRLGRSQSSISFVGPLDSALVSVHPGIDGCTYLENFAKQVPGTPIPAFQSGQLQRVPVAATVKCHDTSEGGQYRDITTRCTNYQSSTPLIPADCCNEVGASRATPGCPSNSTGSGGPAATVTTPDNYRDGTNV